MFAIKRSKSYLNFYKFLQFIVTPILKIIYRVEIINKKNSYVNTENGLILCSNHLSALDPIMMCAYFPKPIYFLAKIEIFRNKFVKSIVLISSSASLAEPASLASASLSASAVVLLSYPVNYRDLLQTDAIGVISRDFT